MRILFIGNSITKGEIGESFVDLFKNQHPDWDIRNAGVNGATLKNISDRIARELEGAEYDFVVIEAGYNDIILPYLDKKGLFFRVGMRYLYRKGRKPVVDPSKFQSKYGYMIQFIQSKSNAKIILTTLGCINENLSAVVNLKRIAYNASILRLANEHDCLVADISHEVETVLKSGIQTDYLLSSLLNSMYFDKKKCQKAGGADKLSKKRNLRLTIDGVHLNSAGALIYKQTIERLINAN